MSNIPNSMRILRPAFRFSIFSLAFWILEFLYQYYLLVPKNLPSALVRSFALTGATLIGAALFSSAIFKWFPRTARYWQYRRYLGVSGAVFVNFHALAAYYSVYDFDIGAAYYTFNPIKNPIVFGSLALPIFLLMALTSTDWAVQKLGGRNWKTLHRFVYIAYPLSIFHFLLMRPEDLVTAPGILLLAITLLALFGQIFWFFKIAGAKHFRSLGSFVGSAIILFVFVIAYLIFST